MLKLRCWHSLERSAHRFRYVKLGKHLWFFCTAEALLASLTDNILEFYSHINSFVKFVNYHQWHFTWHGINVRTPGAPLETDRNLISSLVTCLYDGWLGCWHPLSCNGNISTASVVLECHDLMGMKMNITRDCEDAVTLPSEPLSLTFVISNKIPQLLLTVQFPVVQWVMVFLKSVWFIRLYSGCPAWLYTLTMHTCVMFIWNN